VTGSNVKVDAATPSRERGWEQFAGGNSEKRTHLKGSESLALCEAVPGPPRAACPHSSAWAFITGSAVGQSLLYNPSGASLFPDDFLLNGLILSIFTFRGPFSRPLLAWRSVSRFPVRSWVPVTFFLLSADCLLRS